MALVDNTFVNRDFDTQNLANEVNPQWRKGGMTSNGLRDSSNVINYFYPVGRSNIIPDADASKGQIHTDNPSFGAPVSSIGALCTMSMDPVTPARSLAH